tara:strand:- start:2197 stop:3069 length:873 start_codon:yes stop_codon:yes gene_type:complete
MKVGIYSHCTIDTIVHGDNSYEVPGGPACYCSLTAVNQKFNVNLHTKHGVDFPLIEYLQQNKISMQNSMSDKDTTRFKILLSGSERELFIQNRCEALEFVDEDNDGVIISPVYDEITNELFKKIKQSTDFTLLDPQGFLRYHDSANKISLKQIKLELDDISAIKINSDELLSLTGADNDEGLSLLQKAGIENIILTNKQDISLLVKDKIYSIKLPNLELFDTTGIGDIFCATFCCTMLREKDFLWALSFAGGAAQAALETKNFGIEKVPRKSAVENNGSYFYNMVKFRQI